MEVIKSILASLVQFLEDEHLQKLQTDVDSLAARYQLFCFTCQALPMQAWLSSKMASFSSMQPAVNVDVLVVQLKENDTFLDQFNAQKTVLFELKHMVSKFPDSSQAHAVLNHIVTHFDDLEKKALEQSSTISLFLSRLKLYIASLESWEVMLAQWDNSSNQLLSSHVSHLTIVDVLTEVKVSIAVCKN